MSIARVSVPQNLVARGRRLGLQRRGGVLKGCLIALAVLLVLLIAAGVYAYMNWKTWAAMGMKAATEVTINESTLPQDQKSRIIARVGAVTDEWKDGKITNDQFGKVFETVIEGPIMPLAMVAAAEKQYVNPSSLSNEDKAAAVRTLQRVARGVADKTIKADQVQSLAQMVSEPNQNGQTRLKKVLTNEELKAFLDAAKKKADDANVADEAFTINFADEVDKAIDKALGR